MSESDREASKMKRFWSTGEGGRGAAGQRKKYGILRKIIVLKLKN
jgi:hypothetical protein